MQALVLGGSGLIGRAFAREMLAGGHRVVVLSRNPGNVHVQSGVEVRGWDGRSSRDWLDVVESSDAVVNLIGENIGAMWWTEDRKQKILDSRLRAGKVIREAIRTASKKPEVLLQASAVGYYGPQQTAPQYEVSPSGTDFMSRLVVQWENSTQAVEVQGVRRVVVRSGLVLDSGEGILPRILLPFRLFAGGPLGSGRQGVSWIHLLDEVRAMRFLLENRQARGVYNLVSPNPVSNADFGRMAAKEIKRPYWFPTPGFVLRLVLGEMSTLVLDGQYVYPQRLLAEGFSFSYPDLPAALHSLLG